MIELPLWIVVAAAVTIPVQLIFCLSSLRSVDFQEEYDNLCEQWADDYAKRSKAQKESCPAEKLNSMVSEKKSQPFTLDAGFSYQLHLPDNIPYRFVFLSILRDNGYLLQSVPKVLAQACQCVYITKSNGGYTVTSEPSEDSLYVSKKLTASDLLPLISSC